jgi:glycosyltransferase involved in cell wall biosynthesis
VRLLLVCDHPSLGRGFATVGHQVATGLARTGRWEIDYLGRYEPRSMPHPPPYRVHDVHAHGLPSVAEDDPALGEALVRVLEGDGHPLTLLSIGMGYDHQVLLRVLSRLALRSHFRTAAYVGADYAPAPAGLAEIAARVDALVPYSHWARTVAETCCAQAAVPTSMISEPIPHGVDIDVFRPLPADERSRARRELFRLGPDDLLVGTFGRNTEHKRLDLALRIFHLFATGSWARCRTCAALASPSLDLTRFACRPAGRCARCDGHDLLPGTPRPQARLYLHTEQLRPVERAAGGGWDLALLARRLGIADRVVFGPTSRQGHGVAVEELVARMAACDLHLLPYDSGGWELTVLETAACGVPNVITDTAAPPEYASAFAATVPVAEYVAGRDGLRGLIDVEAAVECLIELADSPVRRARMGEAGQAVARSFGWERAVGAWDRLLRDLAAPS